MLHYPPWQVKPTPKSNQLIWVKFYCGKRCTILELISKNFVQQIKFDGKCLKLVDNCLDFQIKIFNHISRCSDVFVSFSFIFHIFGRFSLVKLKFMVLPFTFWLKFQAFVVHGKQPWPKWQPCYLAGNGMVYLM